VDATKVGMIQTVNSQISGNIDTYSPTRANRQTADGTRIDQLDPYRNPLYATGETGSKDTLGSTATNPDWGQHGTKPKSGIWNPAILKDTPTDTGRGNNSHKKFETAALALSGTQKDMYYGSVYWGWEVDNKGVFKRLPVTIASKGDMPSAGFNAAAKKWNDSTALGTIKTNGDPTEVYDPTSYGKKFTLPKNTEVTLGDASTYNGVAYNEITTVKNLKTGVAKTSDLLDIGDGAKTIDLPIPWKGRVDTTSLGTLRQDKSSISLALADLPSGTELTVINDKSDWLKVHLDPTQKGLIINTLGKKSIDTANLLRGYIPKELVKR